MKTCNNNYEMRNSIIKNMFVEYFLYTRNLKSYD